MTTAHSYTGRIRQRAILLMTLARRHQMISLDLLVLVVASVGSSLCELSLYSFSHRTVDIIAELIWRLESCSAWSGTLVLARGTT